MKITWLGTGGAGTLENWNTNALIEFDDGYKLLIDCGGDCRHALHALGLDHLDIDGIYVSHLHADHIGGIEIFAFNTYFDPRYDNKYDSAKELSPDVSGRPQLYLSEALVDDLWSRSLSGGLGSLQNKRCKLDTYFDVYAVPKNESFHIAGVDLTLVQTIHFVNGYTFELSFGLMFATGCETVFLTTDTQYAPNQIKDFYEQATLIFHDCETGFASGVHSHFDELKGLSPETKKKMLLVHYGDNVISEDGTRSVLPEWREKAEAAGFIGFASCGSVFEFNIG